MTWLIVLGCCIVLLVYFFLRARLRVSFWLIPGKYDLQVRWGPVKKRLLPFKGQPRKRPDKQKTEKPEEGKKKEKKALPFSTKSILDQARYRGLPFLKKVRVEHINAHIVAATGDAAHTAILFGAISAGLGLAAPLIETVTHKKSITVDADYELTKPQFYFSTAVSIRTGTLLAFALAFLLALLRTREKQEV